MRIALVQFDVENGQPERNWEKMEALVSPVEADLVVLPELWHSGYDLAHAAHYADREEEILERLGEIARKKGTYFFAGSLLHRTKRGIENSQAVFSPMGELLARYGKLHLFRLMQEDRYLTEGEKPVLVDTPWGKVGLAICYDFRFPELFRHYALSDARLIVAPAQWPQARELHWKTLIRARAIENQVFVAANNRVGRNEDQTVFGGASALVDPWGETLAEGSDGEGVFLADLDMSKVEEARSRIPILQDRRTDLFA